MSTPATSAKPSTTAATAAASSASTSAASLLPSTQCMMQVAKMAIEQDRAIMMDYFQQTAQGTAYLGEDPQTKERVLIKNKEEFTSLISNMYKTGDEYIVRTENSLYVVSGKIQKRNVNIAALHDANDM